MIVECGNKSFANVDGVQIVDGAILSLVDGTRNPMVDDTKRKSMAADIVAAGVKHDVPILLITAIIYKESSFKTDAKGSLGEVGLMQVHGVARRGCDTNSQYGQIDCGASWLAVGKAKCGTVRGAITAYATGRCKPGSVRVVRIVNARVRLWKKLRGDG